MNLANKLHKQSQFSQLSFHFCLRYHGLKLARPGQARPNVRIHQCQWRCRRRIRLLGLTMTPKENAEFWCDGVERVKMLVKHAAGKVASDLICSGRLLNSFALHPYCYSCWWCFISEGKSIWNWAGNGREEKERNKYSKSSSSSPS